MVLPHLDHLRTPETRGGTDEYQERAVIGRRGSDFSGALVTWSSRALTERRMNGNAWVGVGLPRRGALLHSGQRGPTGAPTCAFCAPSADRVPRPRTLVPDANAGSRVTLPHVSRWILLSQRLLKALCFCTAPCGAVRRAVHSRLVPLGLILFL